MCKWNYEEDGLNVGDGVMGIVTGGNYAGLKLILENGQLAFAKFGGLEPGTMVPCTVLKKATDRWDILVGIDSYENYAVA